MKRLFLIALALTAPLAAMADTIVFNDTFTSGSDTIMVAPSAPTSTYTTWEILSAKNMTASAINSGYLRFTMNAATSSGWGEAQALFTSSPVILSSVGNYIGLMVVFTNTGNTILTGTGDWLRDGLYNSGGSAPTNGMEGGTLAGTTYPTGGAQLWQGFIGSMQTNGYNNAILARPQQNGTGTSSGNQDAIGNNASSGIGNNPQGANLSGNGVSTITLSSGSVYTMYLQVLLTGVGTEVVSNYLYSGAGLGGLVLGSRGATVLSSGTNFVTTFDALAWGVRHAQPGTGLDPIMDITQVQVLTNVPEPGSALFFGFGALALALSYRRIRR